MDAQRYERMKADALKRSCPYCGAKQGQLCTFGDGSPNATLHYARKRKAVSA